MFLCCIIALAIVVIDQITKYFVVANMELGETVGFIKYFIQLTYVENKGAAFSILSDKRWIFILLSVVAIVVMTIFLIKTHRSNHKLLNISIAFMLGGGIGNMIDRTFREGVVDFFEFTFVKFAVFNIADMFITFGAVLLAIYFFFIESSFLKSDKSAKKAESADNAEGGDSDKNSSDGTGEHDDVDS